MEKIVFICEKPSAARNFATALGGSAGEYDGYKYAIVNLIGHILEHGKPHEVAYDNYRDTIGLFSKVDTIPWSHDMFDFKKKRPSTQLGDTAGKLLKNIKKFTDAGYIPCIATDMDESGEGELIAWEVLEYIGYTGKVYREYHPGEAPKEIQGSVKKSKLKEVTVDDPGHRKALSRSANDFMTQQLTRVATMKLMAMGYDLPTVVPFGRLLSRMLVVVGEQEKAIREYKPSSVYESRYKLDNLILSYEGMTQYKTKEEWQADGLPLQAKVKEVKQVPGTTIPPKSLTFSQLAGKVAKQGIKSKRMQDLYQKMYDKGILTYPRTDENFITTGQFEEILPHVDQILTLIGVPTAPFTHRTPRPTHVKPKGNHGALRPGLNIPTSLESLDAEFGKGASLIYKTVAQRFLMMFLEDTEWVRHEYETVGTDPVFKGSIRIITKQGVTDPDEDAKDVDTKLPDLKKMAELYPHEVKSKKPATPTVDWLMKQLTKEGVGTPATQVSTLARLSGDTPKHSIKEAKSLSLSMLGQIGYRMAKDTQIGSVEGTRKIKELAENVAKGGAFEDSYAAFAEILNADIEHLRNMTVDLSGIDVPQKAPKEVVEATIDGTNVKFNRVYGGYRFSDEDIEKMSAGEEITIEITTKDKKKAKVRGTIREQEYKGKKFFGFKGVFVRDDLIKGVWNGKEIAFKNSYGGHKFTEDEVAAMLNGDDIVIEITTKDNKKAKVKGTIQEQEYKGKKFFGFKGVFVRDDRIQGVWNGKEVDFKNGYGTHKFTEDEVAKLLSGETISFAIKNEDGSERTITGALANLTYQGKAYVGFAPSKDPNRAYGSWKGQNISFKREYMGHRFTDEEVEQLLANKKITFEGKSKAGKEMSVTGGLALQAYNGNSYVGFKADWDNKKKRK